MNFEHLYNLKVLDTVFLTADIDWAPDFTIDFMMNKLAQLSIPVTLFATHKSSVLKAVGDSAEIGLHPDYTRVTGRENFKLRLSKLLEVYPESTGTRSHRNLFGQNTCQIASELGLKYDLSHVQFQLPWCQAFIDQWGLVRGSYAWEDGLHLDFNLPLNVSSIDLDSPGLKIFNLHPVLFYLNCVTDGERVKATKSFADLTKAHASDFNDFVNTSRGIQDLTLELLAHLKDRKVKFKKCGDAFLHRI